MSPLDQHDVDEDGEHWPDDCDVCVENKMTVECQCDCGICCESLLIEASIRDAQREPMIAKRGKPMYDDYGTGTRELVGYILNTKEGPCEFFDQTNRRCTIYETRPLCCRTYCCDLLNHRFRDAEELDAEGRGPTLDLGDNVPEYCRDAVLKLTTFVPTSSISGETPGATRERIMQARHFDEISEEDWRDAVESRVMRLSTSRCFIVTTDPNELRFYWRVGSHFFARKLFVDEVDLVLETIRRLAQSEQS